MTISCVNSERSWSLLAPTYYLLTNAAKQSTMHKLGTNSLQFCVLEQPVLPISGRWFMSWADVKIRNIDEFSIVIIVQNLMDFVGCWSWYHFSCFNGRSECWSDYCIAIISSINWLYYFSFIYMILIILF